MQGFGNENLREGDHLEDLGEDAEIILKWLLNVISGTWPVFICLRVCGLLL
jgi:hypothetical protein